MPTGKSAQFPAADCLVEPEGRGCGDGLVTAEGQLVNEVAVEVVGYVEVGVATALARALHVAYPTKTIACGNAVGDDGEVVKRVRPSVVEVKAQAVADILVQGNQEAVVGRGTRPA